MFFINRSISIEDNLTYSGNVTSDGTMLGGYFVSRSAAPVNCFLTGSGCVVWKNHSIYDQSY
jgi:hypothetical protein